MMCGNLVCAQRVAEGRRLRTQGTVPVLGASIAASPFLPYGELPRARCWGRSVRRVPLARLRSAQTELLDVAVQVLGERSCVGT